MVGYPEPVREFRAWFPDEAACRAYLEQVRWPTGPRCPRCPQAEVWKLPPPFYRCALCRHDFTVTAGTRFADTRLPLTLWFEALWHVVHQKHGARALGVQRVLGVSYLTAWRWLHKLRRAMVRPGRDRLAGSVGVDEVYVGGERSGKRGRLVFTGAGNEPLRRPALALATRRLLKGRRCRHHSGGAVSVSWRVWAIG